MAATSEVCDEDESVQVMIVIIFFSNEGVIICVVHFNYRQFQLLYGCFS